MGAVLHWINTHILSVFQSKVHQENIRVLCRIRPPVGTEKDEEDTGNLVLQGNAILSTAAKTIFAYDAVFSASTTQEEVYSHVSNTVDDVINGYNGTIFVYGQTGSGKTHTMFGPGDRSPKSRGIVSRATKQVFSRIEEDLVGTEYKISCSYLEIYQEVVNDLLSADAKSKNLKIKESAERGVYVEGAVEEYVSSESEVNALLSLGNSVKMIACTAMNNRSSRSHTLFIVDIEQKQENGGTKRAKLNLVDLAGSENVSKTKASGTVLEEAKKINQSLSALGNCIRKLADNRSTHIPYRDSRLTRVLSESLGGNCKTTLILAISMSSLHYEETMSTLRFGQSAKKIVTRVRMNLEKSPAELRAHIKTLLRELKSLQQHVAVLERKLRNESVDGDDTILQYSSTRSSALMETGPVSLSYTQQDVSMAERLYQLERDKEELEACVEQLQNETGDAKAVAESVTVELEYARAQIEREQTIRAETMRSEATVMSQYRALEKRYESVLKENRDLRLLIDENGGKSCVSPSYFSDSDKQLDEEIESLALPELRVILLTEREHRNRIEDQLKSAQALNAAMEGKTQRLLDAEQSLQEAEMSKQMLKREVKEKQGEWIARVEMLLVKIQKLSMRSRKHGNIVKPLRKAAQVASDDSSSVASS